MGAHALLAPSSAKRWMTCAPSARLEAKVPERDTQYTREGTVAHAMAEYILGYYLSGNYTQFPGGDDEVLAVISDIKNGLDYPFVTGLRRHIEEAEILGVDGCEMFEIVHEHYCRIVYEAYLAAKAIDPNAELLIEARLKLTEFIPEGFGSSDAVIIADKTLEVFDLKYGKGVKVEAENNPQMMCYALGAYAGPAETYVIDKVQMTIIQPRLRHVSSWEITELELVEWAYNILKPAASRAFIGEGPQVPGDHCRFCKVAAKCRALAEHTLTISEQKKEPGVMTLTEIAEILPHFSTIKSWMNSVEEYALEAALEGDEVPGFKVVEGRSIRKISNAGEAIARLDSAGIPADNYLKPAELKTITDLEKTLTKKGFNTILGDLVIKPEGKPTLVENSDPRQPFSKASNDFKELL